MFGANLANANGLEARRYASLKRGWKEQKTRRLEQTLKHACDHNQNAVRVSVQNEWKWHLLFAMLGFLTLCN